VISFAPFLGRGKTESLLFDMAITDHIPRNIPKLWEIPPATEPAIKSPVIRSSIRITNCIKTSMREIILAECFISGEEGQIACLPH